MNRAMLSQISRHIDDSRQTLEKALRDLSTTIEESQIYIGLNDSETKQQKLATDRYAAILKEVCKDFGVPFSFNVIDGGYIHDDGEYTEEKSIVLTFIDLPQETWIRSPKRCVSSSIRSLSLSRRTVSVCEAYVRGFDAGRISG